MYQDLALLCLSAEKERDILQHRIDECAACGRSYELNCRMPTFCSPAAGKIGFCRSDGEYLLYVYPRIECRCDVPSLRHFFRLSPHSFSDPGSMLRYLNVIGTLLRTAAVSSMPPMFHRLEQAFSSRIIGQETATEAAAFHLLNHLARKAPSRPLSMVLYGPTGVGKSALAHSVSPILQELLPSDNWQEVWTDLNTFTQPHTVSRLIGSPPGYVGYEDRPILEAAAQNPHTVFLFDELEKAHPDILKLFMAILDEGRCAAGQNHATEGQILDFRHCIFIFTTNLDLAAAHDHTIGFSLPRTLERAADPSSDTSLAQRIIGRNDAARRAMVHCGILREIAARFTALIGFSPLDGSSCHCITGMQISALGREFGLHIVSIAPSLVTALTPRSAFSVRSTLCLLESVLTPVFAMHPPSAEHLHLSGTADHPILSPIQT